MSFTVEEVNPADVREEAIDFFWRMRAWPFDNVEDYGRLWDWRYTGLSDGPARVWIAREGAGNVVGHMAAYLRRFRVDGVDIPAAVPGNFLVDPEHRNTLIGPRLATQPRALVRNGRVALVLSYGNEAAHQMFLRQGFRDLGGFRDYVIVRRWSGVLRRRFGPASLLGPLVDAVTRLRWRFLEGSHSAAAAGLRVEELDPTRVENLSTAHWANDARVQSAGNGDYVRARFLGSPFAARRVIALVDAERGSVEAYAAITRTTPLRVWDCRANPDRIRLAAALRIITGWLDHGDTVTISTLPGSSCAAELRAGGFTERLPAMYDRERWWSAYWADDHPLAPAFADFARWQLFTGSTHY